MQPWVRRRAKKRKDGRMVVVTTVVIEADVLSDLSKRVDQPRLRSALISDAIRFAMASPGWLEAATARANHEEWAEYGNGPASKSTASSSRRGAPSTPRAPSSKPSSSRVKPRE